MKYEKTHYLETADRIGRHLCRDAIWDHGRCTWLGWAVDTVNHRWASVYRSLRHDLYAGTSGVALFMAELYQFTNDSQQLKVIDGVLRQILSSEEIATSTKNYGFYSGSTGIAYAVLRIGQLLQREELVARALTMMEALATISPNAVQLDVISGSAGVIPVWLTTARLHQRPALLEAAQRHGEHLLQQAHQTELGWSWDTMHVPGQKHLTGHSHGVAGIVTALLELYQVTGRSDYLNAALEGLRYERYLFSPEAGNWPDLRIMPATKDPSNVPAYYMGWCHGAPGIGLSRLRCVELLPDNVAVRDDLEVALKSTAASLNQTWVPGHLNYSLCHGAAGNAELMIMAGHRLQRPALIEVAEKVAADGIRSYVKQGMPWPCGNGGAGESPNLMLGTAGIGHFYLRLYDSQAVAPILLMT